MNQFSGGPEDAEPYTDDLGLTDDQWHDLWLDYYFGNTEPPGGSIEEEAFRRIAAQDRRDAD